MKHKKILRPDRLRQPPAQFSWVDHRLVREGHLRRCHADGLALYLFLLTVADADGISYYGEETAAKHLSMDLARFRAARNTLVAVGLIAYEHPFYQVLSLDAVPPSAALPPAPVPTPPPAAPQQRGGLRSVGDILSNMGGRP